MGSSAETGKFFIGGLQEQKICPFWVQNIKVPFGIGHPPPTHQTQSICVYEGSGV